MWIQPSCTWDQSYSGYETSKLMHKGVVKYSNLAIVCIHLGRGSCCITSGYENVPFFNGSKQNHLWETSLQENHRSRSEIRWTSLNKSQSLRLNCEAAGHSKCPNLKISVNDSRNANPSKTQMYITRTWYWIWILCILFAVLLLILNLSWFHCKTFIWNFYIQKCTKKVLTKFQAKFPGFFHWLFR